MSRGHIKHQMSPTSWPYRVQSSMLAQISERTVNCFPIGPFNIYMTNCGLTSEINEPLENVGSVFDVNDIILCWSSWKAAWSLRVWVHVCLCVLFSWSVAIMETAVWTCTGWLVCGAVVSVPWAGESAAVYLSAYLLVCWESTTADCGDGVSLHVVSGFPTLSLWLLKSDLNVLYVCVCVCV